MTAPNLPVNVAVAVLITVQGSTLASCRFSSV
nr:MAG TPA: hypothetical protein [Caudoviricetes sp.]